MDELIILATLARVDNYTLLDLVILAKTLQDLFETETTDSEPGDSHFRFWDGAEFLTSLISVWDFFEYILLPEAAALLISQDLNVSKAEADGI